MCSNMILTKELNGFIDQWTNSYALSMCSNMILTKESNGFIDQWINSYAQRHIKLQWALTQVNLTVVQ